MACHRHESGHSCAEPGAVCPVSPSCGLSACCATGSASLRTAFSPACFSGAALLFLAMLFAAAAVIGAVVLVASISAPDELMSSATFRFARAASYIIVNVYALKMAAVFMISDVDRRDPYRHCPALDCSSRICAGGDASDREFFR